jgi:hypothetical protein
LTLAASVAGDVLDWDATRVLYRTASNEVHLRQRATGVDVFVGSYTVKVKGALTSRGALVYGKLAGTLGIDEWRDGKLTELDPDGIAGLSNPSAPVEDPTTPFPVVRGEYATWYHGGGDAVLYRVDTASKLVFAGVAAPHPSVSETGVLHWMGKDSANIYRYTPGTIAAAASVPWVRNFDYDGFNLAWVEIDKATGTDRTAKLLTGGTSIELSKFTTFTEPPGGAYRLAGGNMAFVKVVSGVRQVFRRTPTGAIGQVSLWSTDSLIESMSSDGAIVSVSSRMRYLHQPGKVLPARLGHARGIARWNGAKLEESVGAGVIDVDQAKLPEVSAPWSTWVPDSGCPVTITDAWFDAAGWDSGASDAAPDSGTDTAPDAGTDTLSDSGADATIADSTSDGGPDAGADTTLDAAPDGPVDAVAVPDAPSGDAVDDASASVPLEGRGCSLGTTRANGQELLLALLLPLARRRRARMGQRRGDASSSS